MRTYCIANKSGRFALLVNQEVVCFISFYIILWVIILLFFAKYLSLHRDIQPFAEYAVTPCMGVWIETVAEAPYIRALASHPVWVCGLKPMLYYRDAQNFLVTPCMGVWIETFGSISNMMFRMSHPVWVCGLKQVEDNSRCVVGVVTPCMGVWIETFCSTRY